MKGKPQAGSGDGRKKKRVDGKTRNTRAEGRQAGRKDRVPLSAGSTGQRRRSKDHPRAGVPNKAEDLIHHLETQLAAVEIQNRELRKAKDDSERGVKQRTDELIRANEELEGEIAERRRAEVRLRKSQEKLFDILESISDVFFTLDRNWRFTYVNHEAVRLWRKGLDDLIGRTIWEVAPGAVGTIFEEQYRMAVSEQVPVSFDAFSPLINIWVEVRAYPSREGLTVYFHDITERRERRKTSSA